MYSPGDCIFIETNIYKDGTPKAHLFVVILEAKEDADRTILLPVCTINPSGYNDNTATLKPGDHDFITNSSYIDYSNGRIFTKVELDRLIKKEQARRRNPQLDTNLLRKICTGISKSPHTPFEVSFLYEDYPFDRL